MSSVTLDELAQVGREQALPCALDLNGEPLVLEQCLRLLPGKRLVARAQWRNQRVLAKVFFHKKNWRAEWAGYQRLSGVPSLPTPLLLHSLPVSGGGVVLYQFIENSQGLDTLWSAFNTQQKCDCLQRVKQQLTLLHGAGLAQYDLHLGNFLQQGERLILIDPASVDRCESASQQAENRALLLAQLPLPDRALAADIFQTELEALKNIDRIWHRRRRDYLKKIQRDCTEVAAIREGALFAFCRRDKLTALRAQLLAPEKLLDGARLLKDGNSAKVFIIDSSTGPLVVKQYINKDWQRKLRRALQQSRARRSWYFSHALHFADIRVPAPIAMIEKRHGPLVSQSWFISELQTGSDLLSLWQQTPVSDALLLQVQQLAQALDTSHISHGDMKATNFLVNDQQLFVIDYDGCRQHRNHRRLQRALAKDWRRFRANWPDNAVLQRQLDTCLP